MLTLLWVMSMTVSETGERRRAERKRGKRRGREREQTWGTEGEGKKIEDIINIRFVFVSSLASGAVVLTDRYATAHSLPALDTSRSGGTSDLRSISGTQNTTSTTITFTRYLNTSDPNVCPWI